jgi:hypothetical protein
MDETLVKQNKKLEVINFLDNNQDIRIFNKSVQKELKLEGYLEMSGGLICPLFTTCIYILKPLRLRESKIVMTDEVAGFIFDPVSIRSYDKLNKIKIAMKSYNIKVKEAINEFPSFEKVFDKRFIRSFKLF